MDARRAYATAILRMWESTLQTFCYVDGTTIYLARAEAEAGDKRRARLGAFVWRMSNGKDGLFSDCVGPSLYASSQGQPVKVWGFFAKGKLFYSVLPADGERTTHMNTDRFVKLVSKQFTEWRKELFPAAIRPRLIQDHEKCLWAPASQAAIADAGFNLETCFPKCS